MREYEFTVIIERDEGDVFISHCPALPGCHSEGDTEVEMIKDAISLYVDYYREQGMPIPPDVRVTSVRVSA